MNVSRRSFLTGAASTAAIAATGGIGAAAGGVPVAAITAEDVAIARQYKSIFDTLRGKDAIAAGFEAMLTYRDGDVVDVITMPTRVGRTTLSDAQRRLANMTFEWPNTPDGEPLPLIAVAEEDMLPVEIQGTIERTGS